MLTLTSILLRLVTLSQNNEHPNGVLIVLVSEKQDLMMSSDFPEPLRGEDEQTKPLQVENLEGLF